MFSIRFAAFAALLLLVCSAAMPAGGQAGPSDALILARVFVHEAGWDPATGDMEAIYAVLSAGAERSGRSFRSYAYAYSGRALRGETTRGPWVAQLVEDGTRPSAWPRVTTRCRGRGEARACAVSPHAPWSNYREDWLLVLEHARRVVAGEITHRCETDPHDWGGRVDRARARRLGLIRIECSFGDVDTRNDFYVRPSLACDAEPEGCTLATEGDAGAEGDAGPEGDAGAEGDAGPVPGPATR